MQQRDELELVIEQLEERIAPGVIHKCNSGGGNGSEGDPDCDRSEERRVGKECRL